MFVYPNHHIFVFLFLLLIYTKAKVLSFIFWGKGADLIQLHNYHCFTMSLSRKISFLFLFRLTFIRFSKPFALYFSLPGQKSIQLMWHIQWNFPFLSLPNLWAFFRSQQRIWFNKMYAEKSKEEKGSNAFEIEVKHKWTWISNWMLREQAKSTTIIKNLNNFWRRDAEKVFPLPFMMFI